MILLEFKAIPDRYVVLQILGYILDFYRHLLDSNKPPKKLPPVFPIMLYRGEERMDETDYNYDPKEVNMLITAIKKAKRQLQRS